MHSVRKASILILILWMPGASPASAEQVPKQAFAELEKWFIGTYLEDMEEESGPGRGDSRQSGKNEKRQTDPGRVAEGQRLIRGSALPSGLKVSDLPRELESRLPPLPEGLSRVLVGDPVALVEKTSRRIQDLFDLLEARESGPPRELSVCHVPPGNPSKRKSLSLPEPAIRSHLDHGDYIGRCR